MGSEKARKLCDYEAETPLDVVLGTGAQEPQEFQERALHISAEWVKSRRHIFCFCGSSTRRAPI